MVSVLTVKVMVFKWSAGARPAQRRGKLLIISTLLSFPFTIFARPAAEAGRRIARSERAYRVIRLSPDGSSKPGKFMYNTCHETSRLSRPRWNHRITLAGASHVASLPALYRQA